MLFPYHQQPIVHFDSFTLKVTSWKEVQSFYEGLLGFKMLKDHGTIKSLTLDGKKVLITLMEGGNVPSEPTLGLYHMALLLPTRSDLSNIIKRLIEKQYPVSGLSDHGVSEALYLSDPIGNGFEIYVDRPFENWPRLNGQLDMYTKQADVGGIMRLATQSQGLPSETILGHAHFHVSQLSQARDYYNRVFQFEKQVDYGNSATFISAGGYHHHLGLNIWIPQGQLRKPDETGLVGYHVQVTDRNAFLQHLKQQTITIQQEKEEVYFFDILNQKVTF